MTRITEMIEINWMTRTTGTTGMSRITGMTEMKIIDDKDGWNNWDRALVIGMTVVIGITKKTEMQ